MKKQRKNEWVTSAGKVQGKRRIETLKKVIAFMLYFRMKREIYIILRKCPEKVCE